jgi:hypothetical protein
MNISPGGQQWMNQVFNTPGADAIHKFDIANLHIRTSPATAATIVNGCKHYYQREGFHGPIWVTETGYPADPAYQTEPGYQDGPSSQAKWMTTTFGERDRDRRPHTRGLVVRHARCQVRCSEASLMRTSSRRGSCSRPGFCAPIGRRPAVPASPVESGRLAWRLLR